MTKHIAYVNASIIAGITAILVTSLTLSMTNSVLASVGETAGQKKNVECAGEMHTRNYCDGYHLGKADSAEGTSCETSKYRGDEKSHTKNWRDGYNRGWDIRCGSPP